MLLFGDDTSQGDFDLTYSDSSSAPSPQPSQSLAPTVFVPGERCSNAKLITFGVHSGSTTGLTSDLLGRRLCSVTISSPGVWYRVVGTGGELTVHTCNPATNFDTILAVFRGDCNYLRCVGQDDDDYSCGYSGQHSSFSWNSVVGVQYFVLVFGDWERQGDFDLTYSDSSSAPSPQPSQSLAPTVFVPGERCSNAKLITFGVHSGSTTGLTSDLLGRRLCSVTISSPGVWYRVVGTGGELTVHTCNPATNYDTAIAVFRGGCDYLRCVGRDDDDYSCGYSRHRSSFSWNSVVGVQYRVLVFGDDTSQGDFDLTYSDSSSAPSPQPSQSLAPTVFVPGERCSNAKFITPGVHYGSTTGLTVDPSAASPCWRTISSPGVWYRVVGIGGVLTVHTCNPTTNFDTALVVFRGDCEDLECVGRDDDDFACGYSGQHSSFSWDSVVGVQYFVLVHGMRGHQGDFGLTYSASSSAPSAQPSQSLSPTVLVPGDRCSIASIITPGVYYGSTMGLMVDPQEASPCTWKISSPGVWYRVVGTGGEVTVHTCNPTTNFDTSIAVFRGDCDVLKCVRPKGHDYSCGYNAHSSSLSWDSVAGVEYHVLLFGDDTSQGDFGLTYSASSLAPSPQPSQSLAPTVFVPGHRCSFATLLTPGVYYGSTTGLRVDPSETSRCWWKIASPGVWYRVVGTGSKLAVHTCDEATTFDTKLAVFRGDCDNLECVGRGDDDHSCGYSIRSSSFSWDSVAGVEYHVLLFGDDSSQGDFGLTYLASSSAPSAQPSQSVAPTVFVPGDRCSSATLLTPGVYYGSTTGLSVDPSEASSCWGTWRTISSPGLWYRVVGTVGKLTVHTCNPVTNFDTTLMVFRGDCENLRCVGSDDDDYYCGYSRDHSSFSWFSEPGVEYHVLLFGAEGNFGLTYSDSSSAPSPQPSQSPAPTGFVPGDRCSIAPLITPGVYHGTTRGLTVDPSEASACRRTTYSPGVWFRVVGTGGEVTVHTCNPATNFDTTLMVFRGDCDKLDCLRADHDYSCGSTYIKPSLSWDSVTGVEYHVLLFGYDTSQGDFALTYSASSLAPSAQPSQSLAPTVLVPGQSCLNAKLITPGVYHGTTRGLTVDPSAASACWRTIYSPGVWFRVVGTGGEVTVHACNPATNFDTSLMVFRGDCDKLDCLRADHDYSCGSTYIRPSLSWDSVAGVEYHVLLFGYDTSQGDFGLTYSDSSSAPSPQPSQSVAPTVFVPGERCSIAKFITPGVHYGSTTGLTVDPSAASPCWRTISSPGVWYRVVGIGGVLTVHTCDPTTNFDTSIAVFRGDCEDLKCVGSKASIGYDFTCEYGHEHSSFSWDSLVGVEYHVLLFGYYSHEGDFGLTYSASSAAPSAQPSQSLSPTVLVPGDRCSIATLITPGIYYGSTTGLTVDPLEAFPCTWKISSPGVWYRVVGTGGELTVHTCNPTTNFDTSIAVFRGDCEDLRCVGLENYDYSCEYGHEHSSFSWESVAGVEYHVLLFGHYSHEGDFGLTYSASSSAPSAQPSQSSAPTVFVPGYRCSVAIVIAPGIYYGSTTGLKGYLLRRELCYARVLSPGIWYRIVGTGGKLTVHTCDSATNFDTSIAVFRGDCEDLECVGRDDDDSTCAYNTRSSFFSWDSVAGVEYHVLLFGDDTSQGDFALTYADSSSAPSPQPSQSLAPTVFVPGDTCSNATILTPGLYHGSTTGLTVDPLEASRCWGTISSPGAWYRIVGTGGELTVHTCNPATNFDTIITVFRGDCDNLECVGWDDNDYSCEYSHGHTSFSWSSVAGVEYSVMVFGRLSSDSGDFGLTYSASYPAPSSEPSESLAPSTFSPSSEPSGSVSPSSFPPAAPSSEPSSSLGPSTFPSQAPTVIRERCLNATLITPGVTYGSTRGLPVDPTEAAGCVRTISSPGVWYRVIGTGGKLILNTCEPATDFSAEIAVFRGDCGRLQCVVIGHSDRCPFFHTGFSLLWNSVAGVEYRVLVWGHPTSEGNFGLVYSQRG